MMLLRWLKRLKLRTLSAVRAHQSLMGPSKGDERSCSMIPSRCRSSRPATDAVRLHLVPWPLTSGVCEEHEATSVASPQFAGKPFPPTARILLTGHGCGAPNLPKHPQHAQHALVPKLQVLLALSLTCTMSASCAALFWSFQSGRPSALDHIGSWVLLHPNTPKRVKNTKTKTSKT